jgi:hypothetical protein
LDDARPKTDAAAMRSTPSVAKHAFVDDAAGSTAGRKLFPKAGFDRFLSDPSLGVRPMIDRSQGA